MEYKKNYDYYIFIDFSENLIGYTIIEQNKICELLPKISKFKHYTKLRYKKEYLKSIRKRIERDNILSYFVKYKIKELRRNTEIYSDILDFIKKNDNCIIFISVDNRQFSSFRKLVKIIDVNKVIVRKESDLVKGSPEYQTSLVIDTLLNIERNKK